VTEELPPGGLAVDLPGSERKLGDRVRLKEAVDLFDAPSPARGRIGPRVRAGPGTVGTVIGGVRASYHSNCARPVAVVRWDPAIWPLADGSGSVSLPAFDTTVAASNLLPLHGADGAG
jgi:hypothetical protein